MYDPSDFTHPFPQRGTFLYSESGAKFLGASDADTYADEHAPALIGTHADPVDADLPDWRACSHPEHDADTVNGDRDSRVPTDLDADAHPAGAHADRNRPYDAPARRPRGDRAE